MTNRELPEKKELPSALRRISSTISLVPVNNPNENRAKKSYVHFVGVPNRSGLDFIATTNQEFDIALEETHYGKFHLLLLILSGSIYANTAIAITVLSFVLPAAQCDFELTSEDKGILTAAPMIGMLVGSYFWGCLADTKGRKKVLMSSLLLDGLVGLLSSLVPYFWLFVTLRVLNGFAITGAMGIAFAYLGEFQPSAIREAVLCWMELFWTLGIILLPAIAWAIIPLPISISTEYFRMSSWNVFVMVCSIPSIILGIWLIWFPESPKFLLENGEEDVALDILRDIFVMNTGKSPKAYPIISLRHKERALSIISLNSNKLVRELSFAKPNEVRTLFMEIWEQTKALCKPPHLLNTFLSCAIQFGLTSSYYTLMLWFPELFNRFEDFEKNHPDIHASVCTLNNYGEVDKDICEPIDTSVYLHTLYIGIACIPTSLWLPLCVHKIGARWFLVITLTGAGVTTAGLYFVNSALLNLILSCIFEALTSLAISLIYCVMVELFPTNLRVMAACLALTFGRAGALLGNLLFGYLIELNCIVPILLFAMMLLLCGLMSFFLPLSKKNLEH